jgi:hypothetical protein
MDATKNDALQNLRSFGQKMSEFPHQNMKKGTFEHFLAQKRVYRLVPQGGLKKFLVSIFTICQV